MRYYIIAGEASGDLHGSRLISEIHRQDETAEVRCWGGDKMEAAGATLVKHYRDLAFMGFAEVAKHLGTILANLKWCKQDIMDYSPDVLLLIDYPGFNLRIASWAKKQGFRVVYYISPQIWAWKESRIKQIRRDVDEMMVILPFEKEFYKKQGMEVTYVGHPLAEAIEEVLQTPVRPISEKPVIALLPGSRTQEINRMLPNMLKMVPHFPAYEFVIAQAPGQEQDIYHKFIGSLPVSLLAGSTYELLRQSKAALVTSGTATLEAALLGAPELVCYKSSRLTYWLAKQLIKVKYISLVNLILDKPAVTELIQQDLNEAKLKMSLEELLNDTEKREQLQQDYTRLWELLAGTKAASNAARVVTRVAAAQ